MHKELKRMHKYMHANAQIHMDAQTHAYVRILIHKRENTYTRYQTAQVSDKAQRCLVSSFAAPHQSPLHSSVVRHFCCCPVCCRFSACYAYSLCPCLCQGQLVKQQRYGRALPFGATHSIHKTPMVVSGMRSMNIKM